MLTRGLIGSSLVLVGGLVISTLPPSSVPMGWTALLELRASQAGRMAALSVVVLGMGLLTVAWLRLCRHVAHAGEPGRAEHEDALALVRHAVVVWSAPLVIAPPLFSRDGWSYAAQGMMLHLGVSPYEHGPAVLRGPIIEAVDPMWITTLTPYGPLPLGFGALAAAHTGNPWILVIAHRMLALVGLALLAWAVPRLASWTAVQPALASALALASPLMIANGVAGLHNDLLLAGLLACALVVAAERGWVAGAVLGGLAAAVKAPAGMVCLGVVLVTLPVAAPMVARLRRLVGVAAVSLGTLLGLGVVTGLGIGWVHALTVPASVPTVLSITTLVGGALDWTALHLGLGLPDAALLQLTQRVGTVVALGAAVVVALRAPTGRRDRALVATATVIGVLVLLSPAVRLWYLLWIVPLWCAMRLSRPAWIGLMALSVIGGLVAPLDSSLYGAYLAIVLASMLVALVVVLTLLTRRARVRLRRLEEAHAPEDPARLPQPDAA